jgi:hypothetical protein
MYFKDKKKQCKIEIEGQEFEFSDCESDLEWLMISIDVDDGVNKWKCKGPFLRKKEIQELADWFHQVKLKSLSIPKRISFTEHELSFEFDDKDLFIYFDFDAHPKGKSYNYSNDREYKVVFPLNGDELMTASKYLEKMSQYP